MKEKIEKLLSEKIKAKEELDVIQYSERYICRYDRELYTESIKELEIEIQLLETLLKD